MNHNSKPRDFFLVGLIAVFAMFVIVVRAVHQSITIDEAFTFLNFVDRAHPLYWVTDPGNHVLNTILESGFVRVFGASPLTVRLPALFGALVYTVAALVLCQRYLRGRILQMAALACLTLNPFVQDYLVIARGYSLGLAFMMTALTLLCLGRDLPQRRVLMASLASAAVGLSLSANFSFGIVGLVTLIVFAASFVLKRQGVDLTKLLTGFFVPAPVVALIVCGPALTHFSSKEIYIGTHSIFEMLGSIVSLSFDGPNTTLVNPEILPFFTLFAAVAPFLGALVTIACLALVVRNRLLQGSLMVPLAAIIASALVLQVVFALISGTPFPMNRTIVYAVPFLTLIVCLAVADVPVRIVARASTGFVALVAIFYAMSVRMYFNDWTFDANTDKIYSALRRIEAVSPNQSIAIRDTYFYGLNFYQAIDPQPTFAPIDAASQSDSHIPEGRSIYVLTTGVDDDFVKRHGLKIAAVFAGSKYPDSEIAVKPGVALPVLQSDGGT